MPRAAQRVTDDQPIDQRRAIVGAHGAHSKQFIVAARQNHRLAMRMPEQHAIWGDPCDLDAQGEVIALKNRVPFTHGMLP